MYPGPNDPDYGAFIRTMCDALERRGAQIDRRVIATRSSGPVATPAKYGRLAGETIAAAPKCDVIYAHYLFPTGAIAAFAGRLAHRPWVVTAHGRDVRNLSRPVLRSASQRALSGAAGLIAVSRYLADELVASGLDLPPVTVAHMGVDLERFQPGDRAAARQRLGLNFDGPLVLAVGGLTERKNPVTLLQAVALLRESNPEARLAMVGDGPLASVVDAGARRLGLAGALIRPGAVAHDRVADWMAAADVLAVPSLVEPLGVVALEALASGRPVVATRVGGAAEVVPATGVGAIVSPTDPGDIAGALAAILSSPPDPSACRTAALPHGVDGQARRVMDVLTRAAQ
jgi:glycosyltransferase involved in cell wall biosynthesis